MSLTSLPVTAADILQLQLGIQMFQDTTRATAAAATINAQNETVYLEAGFLLNSNISLSQVAMAVDSLMFGVTDNVNELTKLSTQFLPPQVNVAVANGLNPTVYAAEALGLALAGGNGTSNAFASNFGSQDVAAFAQAVANATGVNASAIQGFATNWINFYTANPAGTFGLSVTLASYGAAFGDAVGVALLNLTAANLQSLVVNALIDNAEGSYVAGTPLGSQPAHASLQGEIQLLSPLTGPLALGNVTNDTVLVAGVFGAGNDLTVSGPGGIADAFIMTATSVEGQDWGTMTFSGFKNVQLALTAGIGGFDMDLGPITSSGNALDFTGNANVFVSVGALVGEGLISLVPGGGIIHDTDSGVLHFGATTVLQIVGTTGGGIIMQGIDINPNGVFELGSATGWNNLAGSVLQDNFTGGIGNVAPGGEGDIFLTNGGADSINLAPGHSANHIEIYGGDGETTTAGGITVYQAIPGSITEGGTGQPGFWSNFTAGATDNIFAFTSSGTSATQVTIKGFDAASDVVDLSVSAWQKSGNAFGLLKVDNTVSPNVEPPASSSTGTPAVFTGELFSGSTVAGSAAGADVILFGGNFADASALGSSLHTNHFGLLSLPIQIGLGSNSEWHEIGIYNDVSNNAHIVDIAITPTADTFNTIFSDDANIKLAVSDMVTLVGVNALSLTGANIHFVS